MLKELSWYIETNRFSEIVKEIEAKAENYSQALTLQDERVDELREEFRSLCQWHIEKSGYKIEEASYINVDTEFFNGTNINRDALNTFEKEIIKAHMYQKHLWEFMGTTGSMTIISKLGMKKDGFEYENYLPIDYRKSHEAKSPISNILKENPNAVPIYMYSDGTITSEYNPEKSKIRFDALKDKSGFDWSRKGWDPNYEVYKQDWHGEYDDNNCWIMVKEDNGNIGQENLPGAKIKNVPVIEIIKDNDTGILYDPGYSLISVYEKIYLLENGEIYGAEEADINETVKMVKTAMAEIGVEKIDVIAGKQSEQKRNSKATENEGKNNQIIKLYKKLLGEKLSEEVEIKTTKEVQEIKKEIIKKTQEDEKEKAGQLLLEKLETIYESGATGDEIIKTIRTNKIKVPLSIKNKQDCKKVGLSEESYNLLQNYYVPETKEKLFSNAIINMLLEARMLLTSGKSLEELFEIVYEDVVQGKQPEEVISIETTFEELCKNPSKVITTEKVEEVTLEALKKAKAELPEQTTIEKQKQVDEAVENIIRNFSAIRMSTGMTPTEAVKLAAKTVGGKNGEAFVPPVSGIVYTTPGMNSSQGSAKEKRIFADIALKEVIEKAKNEKPQTKEVEYKFDETNLTTREKIQTVEVDLYKKKDLKKFLESKEFKESKIDEELIVEYISFMKQSSPAKKMLLLNSKLFEKYIQTHSINTKADLDELFQTRETQKYRIPNLFNKTEREDWYNTESYKKCGVSKEEIEKLIQEEEFNVESNVKSINLTKEYSKTKDLEKQYGTLKEGLSFNEPTVSKIARIATVTKTKSVDKVIEELKAKEKDSSKSKNEITTVQPKIYIPAQIKADGRLNRKILGTVTGKEFVAERNNLMNIPQSFVTEKIANPTSISDMVRQQIAEQLKETSFTCEEKVDSTQSKFVHNEQINIGKTQSSQSVSQEVIQGQTQTEPVEYSVGSKNPKVYKKTEQTPEEIKMAKMNANYEHDKAVLAKEDPMFAKNQFWDVGHAEGSGEITNQEREKIKNEKLQTKIEKLLENINE